MTRKKLLLCIVCSGLIDICYFMYNIPVHYVNGILLQVLLHFCLIFELLLFLNIVLIAGLLYTE